MTVGFTVDMKEVEKAYNVIKDGGLALIKGDIGYGLIGHSEESIRKMYEIKGRPASNPCITVGSPEVLADVAKLKDPRLMDWMIDISQHTTLAVVNEINPDSKLLAGLSEYVLSQCTKDGTIASFLHTGEFIEEMVKLGLKEDFLLVASSGNVSSHGNNYRFEDVQPEIVNGVYYYLDLGVAKYANDAKLATTIVNLTNFTYKRQGVNHDLIHASLTKFKEEVLHV